MCYAVIEIGGTKSRIAVTDSLSELTQEPVSVETDSDPERAVGELVRWVEKLAGGKKLLNVAMGIRGQIAEDKRSMHRDTILRDWVDFPIVEKLEKKFKVPVYLENDTALAGLGEAVFGAGSPFELVAYHSVSAGVGGVRIDNKRIDEASIGFEPGHQIIDIDRTVLGDDISPTLENLVSGSAVEKRMGVKPHEIDQSDVIWETLADYLGQGLRNTILYWSPDVIVLGGSMIVGSPRIQIDDIRRATVRALDGFTDSPFITLSTHKDQSGLYGALAYLGQQTEEPYAT